jgi:hypothetical protein
MSDSNGKLSMRVTPHTHRYYVGGLYVFPLARAAWVLTLTPNATLQARLEAEAKRKL